MPSILTSLFKWAETLPFWEQAALDQIISGRPFDESDYQIMIQYLLEDKGLIEKTSTRPELNHLKPANEDIKEVQETTKLLSISNLTNINALAENQRLTFHDQLTVIYGDNGSGKSGYARVMGCAGFTRGDNEVFPNVMTPVVSDQPQTADIEMSIRNEIKSINYTIGETCPELGSLYVFDSKSVDTHLTKYNKISFSPSGLSYLTRLSKAFDDCSQKLTREVASYPAPHNFGELFAGNSEVKSLIADLGAKTDLRLLGKLGSVTDAEASRIQELDLAIAELKANENSKKIADLKLTIRDLKILCRDLKSIEDELSQSKINRIITEILSAKDLQQSARQSSVSQFQSPYFTQTGSPAWLEFVKSAKKIAALEHDSDEHADHNKCLLCRQDLAAEAKELLERLWRFLEDSSQERLVAVERDLLQSRRQLASVNLDCINEQNVSRRYLEKNHPAATKIVSEFINSAKRNRRLLLDMIDSLEPAEVESLPDCGITEIQTVIEFLDSEVSELEESNPEEKIKALSFELVNLQHRLLLKENFSKISGYVEKLKWVEKAHKSIGNTKHITTKYNELFKELVTDRYIKLFEAILISLKCPLKIKIETKAQKGETFRSIVLGVENSARGSQKIEKVLSEGEKRAVALADFLTEIALDEGSSGIVLDDPVTSLDWAWKETVAESLAKEARKRQVIVFTHDVHFLYLIKKYAAEHQIKSASHWIRKKGENEPGYIYLNNSPASEQELRKTDMALEFWRKAKTAVSPSDEVAYIQQGFDTLRASYEALVIYDIFGKVVVRFEARVSIERLKNVVADRDILEQVMQKYASLSRYIGAHLHSDYLKSQSLTPEMLKKEIDDFDALKTKIKTIRNPK